MQELICTFLLYHFIGDVLVRKWENGVYNEEHSTNLDAEPTTSLSAGPPPLERAEILGVG